MILIICFRCCLPFYAEGDFLPSTFEPQDLAALLYYFILFTFNLMNFLTKKGSGSPKAMIKALKKTAEPPPAFIHY